VKAAAAAAAAAAEIEVLQCDSHSACYQDDHHGGLDMACYFFPNRSGPGLGHEPDHLSMIELIIVSS
jgi:hypothetical protein